MPNIAQTYEEMCTCLHNTRRRGDINYYDYMEHEEAFHTTS